MVADVIWSFETSAPRKSLILARELGLRAELKDVEIEPLLERLDRDWAFCRSRGSHDPNIVRIVREKKPIFWGVGRYLRIMKRSWEAYELHNRVG